MVSAYINSHLISPASLKYIITSTAQEDSALDPETQSRSWSLSTQLRAREENKSNWSQYLNFRWSQCDSLPKTINVSRAWPPSGGGRLRLCDPLLCSLQTYLLPKDEVKCSELIHGSSVRNMGLSCLIVMSTQEVTLPPGFLGF